MNETSTQYAVSPRNKVRLMRQRGSYEKQQVYDILDAALLCNVGYVIDGQPYVTPTAFWREKNIIYWHGSSASRALINQIKNIDVCLTVTHVDGLVVARSGFHSSVNYRSVMAFGKATLVEDAGHKRRAMDIYIDRFVPDRTSLNRASTDQELAATKLLSMNIDEASAKIRTGQPVDDDEDYALPVWAGVIAFKTVIDAVHSDPRNLSEVAVPPGVQKYVAGARLDETLASIYDANKTSSHG